MEQSHKILMDKILAASNLIAKRMDTDAKLRNENRKGYNEIMSELNGRPSKYVEILITFVGATLPVSSGLLQKVRETATEEELNVLEKHGIGL